MEIVRNGALTGKLDRFFNKEQSCSCGCVFILRNLEDKKEIQTRLSDEGFVRDIHYVNCPDCRREVTLV